LGFFEDAGTGPVGFSFPVPAGTLEMFGDKNMGVFHQNLHHRKREIHEELFVNFSNVYVIMYTLW
jgi:hypothetical protein